MSAVQPWEGSPRSAASTASRSEGSNGPPVGLPSAARTTADSPGLGYPAPAWWWSMAVNVRIMWHVLFTLNGTKSERVYGLQTDS